MHFFQFQNIKKYNLEFNLCIFECGFYFIKSSHTQLNKILSLLNCCYVDNNCLLCCLNFSVRPQLLMNTKRYPPPSLLLICENTNILLFVQLSDEQIDLFGYILDSYLEDLEGCFNVSTQFNGTFWNYGIFRASMIYSGPNAIQSTWRNLYLKPWLSQLRTALYLPWTRLWCYFSGTGHGTRAWQYQIQVLIVS